MSVHDVYPPIDDELHSVNKKLIDAEGVHDDFG